MKSIPLLDRRRAAALFGDDTGAATAEYAITTMATIAGIGQEFVDHENRWSAAVLTSPIMRESLIRAHFQLCRGCGIARL